MERKPTRVERPSDVESVCDDHTHAARAAGYAHTHPAAGPPPAPAAPVTTSTPG